MGLVTLKGYATFFLFAHFLIVTLLDIAAVTSYRNFITRMADALGVELTEDYKNLRKDYVESLMVGKQLL